MALYKCLLHAARAYFEMRSLKILSVHGCAIILSVFALCDSLVLPSYFTKCKKHDPKISECILENMNKGWPIFVNGDDKYHIQNMNPLHVNHMHVKVDKNLYGNLTDGKITGMENIKFKTVKLDLEKRRFDATYHIPACSIAGNYDIDGKIFNLPLSGSGFTNVTFVGADFHYFFEYELEEMKGKQYIKITDSYLKNEEIERVQFQIDLLRNRLGEEVNKALNENWRDIKDEVSGSVELAFTEIITTILKQFFKKVPFDEFFD